MQFHTLPSAPGEYSWIAVEGLQLEKPPKIDKVLDELQRIIENRKVPLQILQAKYIGGPKHAFHAGNLAVTAHHEKRARADRIEIELLLYLTGKRQIGEAIKSAGVTGETREIAVIGLGSSKKAVQDAVHEAAKTLHGQPEDKLLEISKAKRNSLQEFFQITENVLTLVTGHGDWKDGMLKCVMERGAMLDALKK